MDELVALAKVSHPIPFRTRSLNPLAPMVLCLKARESRSPPVLLSSTTSPSSFVIVIPLKFFLWGFFYARLLLFVSRFAFRLLHKLNPFTNVTFQLDKDI